MEQLWIITKMGRKNMSCFTKTDYDTEWKENGMTMAIRGVSFLGKTAKNTGMKLFGLRQTENKKSQECGWKEGKRHGAYICFNHDGTVRYQCTYIDGKEQTVLRKIWNFF